MNKRDTSLSCQPSCALSHLLNKVHCLEHGALALLRAGEDELGHAALLSGADVDQTTTNGAVVAAHAVGSVGSGDRSAIARALLRSLALRSDSTVGYSTETANARPARKAATSATANTVGVVVGRGEVLAVGRGAAATAALSSATTDASAHKIAHSLATLASCKVLATLVLGSWLLPQIFNRRRTTRLANGVLTSTGLTRSEGAGHGSSREADRPDERGPGTIGSLSFGIDRKGRKVLLMAAAEGVGRRRWQRYDVLGRCVGLLGWRCAA
jgi:hypothetical protein